jgi:hypothetical protein
VHIVSGSDSVTLTCSDVVGSSTVKASFLVIGNANPLDSSEYAALDSRIGSLSNLNTTDRTNVVSAVNSINGKFTQLFIKTITGTTTSTGAITPNIDVNNYYIIQASIIRNGAKAGFALWRGKDGYVHCFNSDMTVMANESVSIDVVYCKRSELKTE